MSRGNCRCSLPPARRCFGFVRLELNVIALDCKRDLKFRVWTVVRAENVSGLKVRAAVLMSGVQVGTVADVKLAPDGRSVTITLRIFSQYVTQS